MISELLTEQLWVYAHSTKPKALRSPLSSPTHSQRAVVQYSTTQWIIYVHTSDFKESIQILEVSIILLKVLPVSPSQTLMEGHRRIKLQHSQIKPKTALKSVNGLPLMLKQDHRKQFKCQCFKHISTLLSKSKKIWNNSKRIFLFLSTASLNTKSEIFKQLFYFLEIVKYITALFLLSDCTFLKTAESSITLRRYHLTTEIWNNLDI